MNLQGNVALIRSDFQVFTDSLRYNTQTKAAFAEVQQRYR